MTEINDKGSIANIESFLKEKEEQLKGITPGPWKSGPCLSGSENHRGFWLSSSSRHWNLGTVNPIDVDGQEGGRNAEFISQSPELVSTLIRLVRAYRAVAVGYSVYEFPDLKKITKDAERNVDDEAQRILNDNGKVEKK